LPVKYRYVATGRDTAQGVFMTSLLDPEARGRVILVGAGPGDPELLTLKAVKALQSADVVVHDGLVDERVFAHVPATAQRISVAKKRDRHTLSQDAINALIVAHVKTGAIVVRLKGGDPFVFGRGGDAHVDDERAAVPGARAMRTLLADLGDLVEREQVLSPAILVIGEVVLLSDAENRLKTLATQAESLA
jgi:siroheme synthase